MNTKKEFDLESCIVTIDGKPVKIGPPEFFETDFPEDNRKPSNLVMSLPVSGDLKEQIISEVNEYLKEKRDVALTDEMIDEIKEIVEGHLA